MTDTSASQNVAPAAQTSSRQGSGRTPGLAHTFFKETRGKLITTLAALLVALVIATATDVLGWLAGQAGLLRDRIVAPVVERSIAAQLENEQSSLRVAMRETVDSAINANAGSVVAGSFGLSADRPRFTIPFYLPEQHFVDLSLSIKGLAPGEIIQITSRNPLIEASTISRDGNYEIEDIRQLSQEESAEFISVREVMRVSEVRGRAAHYFPIHLDLTFTGEGIGASDAALQSNVRGEFVGLLTPPIRSNGDD